MQVRPPNYSGISDAPPRYTGRGTGVTPRPPGSTGVVPVTATPSTAGWHFNYATGRMERDRDPGRGFSASPNQGAQQQSHSPVIPGMNPVGDAGRTVNVAANLPRRVVDPATAASLRNWNRIVTTPQGRALTQAQRLAMAGISPNPNALPVVPRLLTTPAWGGGG